MINCVELREKWPDVRRTGEPPKVENIASEQLARMLDVYAFLHKSRTRLQDQMRLISYA
jgi:hypothetical protein